ERAADCRQAGLVVEQPADGNLAFAGLGEFGPVPRHRGVEVEPAAGNEDVSAEGRRTLGTGPNEADRVLLPRPARGAGGSAAPEIDDRLAVGYDADGGSDLAARVEVLLELGAHCGEPRVALAFDGHRRLPGAGTEAVDCYGLLWQPGGARAERGRDQEGVPLPPARGSYGVSRLPADAEILARRGQRDPRRRAPGWILLPPPPPADRPP